MQVVTMLSDQNIWSCGTDAENYIIILLDTFTPVHLFLLLFVYSRAGGCSRAGQSWGL